MSPRCRLKRCGARVARAAGSAARCAMPKKKPLQPEWLKRAQNPFLRAAGPSVRPSHTRRRAGVRRAAAMGAGGGSQRNSAHPGGWRKRKALVASHEVRRRMRSASHGHEVARGCMQEAPSGLRASCGRGRGLEVWLPWPAWCCNRPTKPWWTRMGVSRHIRSASLSPPDAGGAS